MENFLVIVKMFVGGNQNIRRDEGIEPYMEH